MAMDNITIRKAQLEQLDKFVKQLYDETQLVKKYGVDLKDLEMLYLHIHELIEELLQCNTTDEFMAMIQQLHQAIAGVLIVIAPASADQVKADMSESHTEFNDEEFEEFIANLQKTSASKFSNHQKQAKNRDKEEEVTNDPEELLDMMDLKDHVKPKSKKEKASTVKKSEENTETDDSDDPFSDVYKGFE